MNNLLYISAIENSDHNGIFKKIDGQIRAFRGQGFEVDLIHRTSNGIGLNGFTIMPWSRGFVARLLFYWLLLRADEIKSKRYRVIYLRNPDWAPPLFFLTLLRFLRSNNPKAHVILEIPTYPFDHEFSSFKQFPLRTLHRICRRNYHQYVDGIVYMGKKVTQIWGIPAIQVHNCVDVGSLPLQPARPRAANHIAFVGIARLAYWHGFDRLIRAIHEYKISGGKRRIRFDIIGDGKKEFSRLVELAKALSLLDKEVFFHGPLAGFELDKIVSACDIGVDSLGRHRSGVEVNSSLKSKEYLARGLPVIMSHRDDALVGVPYCLKISESDSTPRIADILKWYEGLDTPPAQIREFAQQKFDWRDQIVRICDFMDVE